ncbi:PREDICTED: von Willebrand factor A domain-containing protein 5B1, partial [Fulmarus glacialis]|uniref:von Willebrand factor A domain-containing protein 5B1 n=1 Tax=Fulmarus glacialis TaxID=30455 RepID=UPI00051BDE89
DALLVILKSLMPACLFNVIGFGSTFKTLFPASQTYCEESLAIACESIKRIRADMGGTNILSPLKWVIRQPIHRGHPRLLFLLTDGAVSNTGKVLELLRNHSCSTRCYSFGIGPNACRRLVRGLAAVSRGIAEFLAEGERLQPKMIKSLKKAMAPVLSDVSVEWVFPESTEVLVSPVSTSCLFPGDRLVGYGVICDTSPYISNPRSDKRRRYSMMRSQESGSSVFFHSQEEAAGVESWNHSRDSEGCCPAEHAPGHLVVGRDPGGESDTDTGTDVKPSSRRRAYSTTQIADHEPCKKVPTASDPGTALVKNPLRKTHLQDLQQVSPEPWQVDFQPFAASPHVSATRIRGAGARRPSLLHQSCLSFCHDSPPVPDGLQQAAPGRGLGPLNASTSLRSSSDSRSPGDLESAQHPSFTFETETSSDWEPQDFDFSAAHGSPHSPRTLCKAVVKGLRSNEPVQWEVAFDIRPLFQERESQADGDTDLWSETFHHLAAKSVIRDFEQLAEKECEIEHGSGRRYQVNAVHTSKACNVISKYTAFMPVDLSTNAYLPAVVEYTHTDAEESSLSPCSTHSSSGCGLPEGPLQSLSASSAQAQKSIESLFAARLTFNKTRLLTRAAKGFMSKSPSRVSEASSEGDNENIDYLPLASLQLACGAFLMNSAFCDAVNIPMEKLKWTSPFACHRLALSPSSSYSTKKANPSGDHKSLGSGRQLLVPDGVHGKSPTTRDVALGAVPERPSSHAEDTGHLRHFSGSAVESISKALKAEKELSPPAITIRRFSSPESTLASAEWQANSGQGSETDGSKLVAAKASLWLSEQDFPEGYSLATVKAAAQQLFVLLRHWDENLEFNLLCYNPSSV